MVFSVWRTDDKFEDDPEMTGDERSLPTDPSLGSMSTATKEEKKRDKMLTQETILVNDIDDESVDVSSVADYSRKSRNPSSCCTQKIGSGIVKDFKQTIGTYWLREMTNFNQKTVAVTFFLFFAAIAPAITFGAIYAKVTNNYIGPVEMIAATAGCGIFYALVGGMPIMINGGTGPVLAFTGVLYKMSQSLDVPFLTFNAWVGLWVCLYMILAGLFHMNKVISYATRFTDDIFALLIAAIFIIDALGSPFQPVGLYYYFDKSHESHNIFRHEADYSYLATAFCSLILGIGTTTFAFFLRGAKFSPFCCNQFVRTTIADFAVITSILFFTILDKVIFTEIDTETLKVPDVFAPSFDCCTQACDSFFPDDCPLVDTSYGRRPWMVDLFDLNGKTWVVFVSALPAVLAFILVFLDDGITWHLINHPTHRLKHGTSYNYDTVIIGFMIGVCSIFGLPWLVAATVRSLNHLHALANKSENGTFISVQETRLVNFFVHVLVLVSIFVLSTIKLIPVPVLYGVFLFMGLVSLGTNQFWTRFTTFFMQPSQYPANSITKHVEIKKMHLYTAIQILLFVLLYAVKSIKAIAIAFPLIIAACIPIRLFVLPRMFTRVELILLDGDEEEIEEWMKMNSNGVAGDHNDAEANEENELDGYTDDDIDKERISLTK